MTPKDATPLDVRLAQLAARQHGVVSVRQLLAFGFTRDQIRFRTATGRLHRLHRGVYAVGHTALPWQAPFVAAVLVAGEGAVLSHGSAAAWWAIRPRPSGNVHVTIPRNTGRDRHHRVTIHRAHPNARGIPTLRALRREHGDHGDWRQSDFEAYIIDICRTHGIPLPQTNVPLLGEVVDAYWPEYRVVAEPDGMTWHGTRAAARRDRKNDGVRMANGVITVRITDEQAQRDGRAVAAAIICAMRR